MLESAKLANINEKKGNNVTREVALQLHFDAMKPQFFLSVLWS